MFARTFVLLVALYSTSVHGADKIAFDITSAGYEDGNLGSTKANGVVILATNMRGYSVGGAGRGIHLAAFDPKDGSLIAKGSFDTCGNGGAGAKAIAFLNQLSDGTVVSLATCDEHTEKLRGNEVSDVVKKLLGATQSQYLSNEDTSRYYRASYILISTIGATKPFYEKGSLQKKGRINVIQTVALTTTSTTVTSSTISTTTTNTVLQDLHQRLIELEGAGVNGLKDLVKAVEDIETGLTAEVQARKDEVANVVDAAKEAEASHAREIEALKADNDYERSQREILEQAVNQIGQQFRYMQGNFSKFVDEFASTPPTVNADRDSSTPTIDVPEIQADGEGGLNIRGGSIVFESDQCAAADLCTLQKTVNGLVEKFNYVLDDDGN